MRSNYRTRTMQKHGSYTTRCLSIAFIVSLSFWTVQISQAQTEFQGSLDSVTITDAMGTNMAPVADISFTQNEDIFSFDASGSSDQDGTITAYKWEFSDGTTASGPTTSFQNASLTAFTATLTVTDDSGGISILHEDISPVSGGFYWSMDTLPAPTVISDQGDLTITEYKTTGISVPGVSGNAIKQDGYWTTYYFPAETLPSSKGTIELSLQHDFAPNTGDSTTRIFFRTTAQGNANSLYAYTYKDTIYFYLIDSTGTSHRTFKVADTWQSGTWHKYEFIWDSAAGYIGIKRDGIIIAENTSTPWSPPNLGGQDMYIGYVEPIGTFDELKIF